MISVLFVSASAMQLNEIVLSIAMYYDETVRKRNTVTERTSKRMEARGKGRTLRASFFRVAEATVRAMEGSGEVEYRCFHSH